MSSVGALKAVLISQTSGNSMTMAIAPSAKYVQAYLQADEFRRCCHSPSNLMSADQV
ncbi:MAG: hypothetical protein HC840_21730 [Leptolyngbyaceae cyanobacterium RM2_2_4]|nr:hypothetical protein [Leptolyngbyaceae cyanobacterium RM2_2_4]